SSARSTSANRNGLTSSVSTGSAEGSSPRWAPSRSTRRCRSPSRSRAAYPLAASASRPNWDRNRPRSSGALTVRSNTTPSRDDVDDGQHLVPDQVAHRATALDVEADAAAGLPEPRRDDLGLHLDRP